MEGRGTDGIFYDLCDGILYDLECAFLFSPLHKQEIVDWSKPMLGQVHRVGNLYEEWIHMPVDKELRLFESNFLEFFSKSPWWVVPSVWVPVILYVLYMSVSGGPSVLPWIPKTPRLTFVEVFCYASAGILLWTLIEYSLHRFIFHATPPSSSRFLVIMHFMLHGQHHKVMSNLHLPHFCACVFNCFIVIIVVRFLWTPFV